jgi:REP element-mobilizing transposase RayT
MARIARYLVEGGGYYHVHAKVACCKGEYHLKARKVQRKLLETIKHYASAYRCDVASVCIMGNHWHAVFKFDCYEDLGDEEIFQRAKMLYPSKGSQKILRQWTPSKWKQFNKRLFNISELMRNIQMHFARWYNREFDRQGKFWGDRFKSTYLSDLKAVRDCMLYLELNPVRAGIVNKPEEYKGSSLYLRDIGKDDCLLSLSNIFGVEDKKTNLKEYKAMIYYRGAIKTKERQASIPKNVVDAEEKRGFKSRGVFAKRIRYFVDGIAIGTSEEIEKHIAKLREANKYQKRKNPICQKEYNCYTAREQRSHNLHFGKRLL